MTPLMIRGVRASYERLRNLRSTGIAMLGSQRELVHRAACKMPPRLPWLRVLRFTFGNAFAYNSYVFMIVLKFLYFLFLIVFVYLSVVFTGILSFLKVNFFGI
jgi:hypothetical protein